MYTVSTMARAWQSHLERRFFLLLQQLFHKAVEKELRDLEHERQRQALQSTAQYIELRAHKARQLSAPHDVLQWAATQTSSTLRKGLILEFGVYSATTLNQLADAFPKAVVYGFDSFEGLPEDWRTGFERGTFARAELPQVRENAELVVGWFADTLPKFVKKHTQAVRLLHLDADLYSSTVTVLKHLRLAIKPGTIVVFDEYWNYPGWQEGEHRAWQEFCDRHQVKYEYGAYCRYHEQVAVRVISVGRTARKKTSP